jgi:hypothetical protein
MVEEVNSGDGGSRFLWNIGLLNCMASDPRRLYT